MSPRPHSRQKSRSSIGSNRRPSQSQPYTSDEIEHALEPPFEPCAATGSLFLYAEGSSVVCLHHDTLAVERRFEKHTDVIQFICVDNVSERGQGKLVVTYDAGHTAIVWNLLTGEQISRFASYEPLTAAAWMRNGNLTFGNEKGELILFEPASNEHVSAHTIFDPVTAIAPSSDCRTFAIGFRNGSILLASLQPTFTILHTLSTPRAPSEISALAWHASSSKQKSDMLATNTVDGDLRVWSVAKPPGSAQPRVIRSLHRSDSFAPSRSWICWSKNGKILQLYEGVTWAWDVRTKDVTYQSIPTMEFARGIAAYGPTGTLFTLGPDHTIQQYDIDGPQMVANVRHLPRISQASTQGVKSHLKSDSGSDRNNPRKEPRHTPEPVVVEQPRQGTPQSSHRRSNSYGNQPLASRLYENYPAYKTEKTATTISLGAQSSVPEQLYSPSSSKSAQKQARARQDPTTQQPQQQQQHRESTTPDLFPFIRARLSDVPYQQPRGPGSSALTPDDLRKQMLNVVFGWQDDIRSLIGDELSHHPEDSPSAVFLARWLDMEPNQVANIFRSTPNNPALDWMRLALNSISNEPRTRKMAQMFTQKLLAQGDVHSAVCLLVAIGDHNDAIEIYVSRNLHMEAVLLTCLLVPSDWQRLSHLVRNWGEHVVQLSQHALAVRCFSCTGVEPTEPWTSPTAQIATRSLKEEAPTLQPSIFHKTMERRGLQDPSPQAKLAPPVNFPVKTRTPADGGLKLITTFGSGDDFKFPGLLSEEGTPINAAFITPIADSALPRSAASPGGIGAYGRTNNMRSLTGALALRTGTPASSHRSKLPSIGEAPIDDEETTASSGPTLRLPPTPADSGSDREKSKAMQDRKAGQALLPTLLTSARYDPRAPGGVETPHTAVVPRSEMSFSDRRPLEIERPATTKPQASSRARKPDGLSVQTRSEHESQTSQELLLPYTYGEPIQRPATTTAAYGRNRSEFASPPNTGDSLTSFKSAKSPTSFSNRSLDQYISSLEQAQYYRSSRSRGNSVVSKQSRDELSERRYERFTQTSKDSREDDQVTPMLAAKRSPSSPIPMAPEELRLHTASVESFDSAYLSAASYTNNHHRMDSVLAVENDAAREESVTSDARRRHRSRSRTDNRAHSRHRASGRRHSPDREAGRGRSSSRKGGSITRSPESPVPMIPSEEDLRGAQDVDPALRFVAQNRQRLNRSSSRADSSTDRRNTRVRSRSRQPESMDSELSRKSSVGARNETRRRQDTSFDTHQADLGDTGRDSVSGTSDADQISLKGLQHLPHHRRKQLAQAELEARRLSLQSRPSAPAVPFPGQIVSSPPPSEFAPPLFRAHTDQGLVTLASMNSNYPSRTESAGAGKSRPQTPRAMKHPAHGQNSAPDLPNMEEVVSGNMYQVPLFPDASVMTSKKNRSGSFNSPEVPFDMPKHPAFDMSIATSRPSSQNTNRRAKSPARAITRETRTYTDSRADFPVVTIGEEDYSGGEVIYATPASVIPELQHLAAPPPPPPPPPVPPQGLRMQHDNRGLLPQTTYLMDPMAQPNYQQQSNSGAEKQLGNKLRNLVGGRIRSQSRGRSQSRTRDNAARSPNAGTEELMSPYESIQPAQPAQFPLSTVNEGR